MIIDAHVHICPDEIRKNREKFLDGEPEFAAIYKDPKAKLIGVEELIEKMDEDGVHKSVVFGFPWRKKKHYRLNNDYVLEAHRRYPDRIIPFCCFSLDSQNIEQEVDRCLAQGAKGVGEVAFYTRDLGQDERKILGRLARQCSEGRVPILLHTNEPVGHLYLGKSPMTLRNLYLLIKENIDTKWILAHLGGGLPFFGFMKKEVKEVLINCWFDTAAMIYLYKKEALKIMCEGVGIEKFIFGSDYPLISPKRYFKEFSESGLSASELENLLGKNFLAIYKRDSL